MVPWSPVTPAVLGPSDVGGYKRRRHSAEFKAEAVRVLDQRGDRTVAETAESFGT